jgi:hypothetical protein
LKWPFSKIADDQKGWMTMYLLKRIKIFKPWINFTDCLWLNMMRALLHTARYFKYLSTRKIYLQKKLSDIHI